MVAKRQTLLKKQYVDFGVRGHDGVDFELPYGTDVIVVDEGKVLVAKKGLGLRYDYYCNRT